MTQMGRIDADFDWGDGGCVCLLTRTRLVDCLIGLIGLIGLDDCYPNTGGMVWFNIGFDG